MQKRNELIEPHRHVRTNPKHLSFEGDLRAKSFSEPVERFADLKFSVKGQFPLASSQFE